MHPCKIFVSVRARARGGWWCTMGVSDWDSLNSAVNSRFSLVVNESVHANLFLNAPTQHICGLVRGGAGGGVVCNAHCTDTRVWLRFIKLSCEWSLFLLYLEWRHIQVQMQAHAWYQSIDEWHYTIAHLDSIYRFYAYDMGGSESWDMFSFLKYEYHLYNRNPSCCNISIFTTGIHHDVTRLAYEWHDTIAHVDSIYTGGIETCTLFWSTNITHDIHLYNRHPCLKTRYRGAMRVLQRGHGGFF